METYEILNTVVMMPRDQHGVIDPARTTMVSLEHLLILLGGLVFVALAIWGLDSVVKEWKRSGKPR